MIARFAVLSALLTLAACATTGSTGAPAASGASAPEAATGGEATDFTLRDVDGRDVRLSDYAGKVVLVDFWATWCTPCEAELPHLQALYDKYGPQGFVVLAVAMDGPETIAGVAPFARTNHLTFPVLLDEETKVVGIYNPKLTAPLSILIDRAGRVAKTRQGYSVGDETLIEQDVAGLVAAR